ncbi:hypothetical protein SAMN05720470_10117 [Fibrobacter sp. UWOV1]|uniref:hypothetical protein n=1 Tax=Fibrobacter sp. UWOV1 TaxID=1896215 RepID=UPI0009223680|nr:hypothetical protein [Fibrobacter sp. UWOV1]SHK27665.1 hypothetical protein SAMN05720470_10117 [Fibrobacter sp. UWOV1]
MKIELTKKEVGTIKCALARYKEFCDNCVSAFKGTGHDDYYKGRKEETEKLQEKFYTITNNAEIDNNEG